jgi:hypothetical protein
MSFINIKMENIIIAGIVKTNNPEKGIKSVIGMTNNTESCRKQRVKVHS